MKVQLFFAAVLACFAIALGLKCYECSTGDSSVVKGDCGDTFNKADKTGLLKTCDKNATFCKKRKTGVNHVYNKVTRECATECTEKNIIYVDRVTCCTADGCNSASGVVLPVTLMFSCVVAVVYFIKNQ